MTELPISHDSRELLVEEQVEPLRSSLIAWFCENQRDLPWRRTDDPYAVWVSEIMLQQTQVATVIDYYHRWLEAFPTVETLADAERDSVMEIWAGLGYYRRARMLHRAAAEVVSRGMPTSAEEWLTLPGVGRYTAGAIASTVFNEAAPIVDGNVIRVYSRLFALGGQPRSSANMRTQWALAEALVDPEQPGDFNQSVMELGATVCTPKKPACLLCPIRDHCQAFGEGDPTRYPEPAKRARPKPAASYTAIVSLTDGDVEKFLIVQRPSDVLLGGLWEFPTIEVRDPEAPLPDVSAFVTGLSKTATSLGDLGTVDHVFSHLKMTYTVTRWSVKSDLVSTRWPAQWVTRDALAGVALSRAMRKVEELMDTYS